MAPDDGFECRDAVEAHLVHLADAGLEGRVMHEHQGRPTRLLGESCVEPVKTFGTELAAAFTGYERIKRNQPHRPILDYVVQEPPVARQVAMPVEGPNEVRAVIVVARNQIKGHGERRDDVTQALVLLGLPSLDEIPGRDRHVGTRTEAVQVSDRALQMLDGPEIPVVSAIRCTDVRVADLCDEHGLCLAQSGPNKCYLATRWRSTRSGFAAGNQGDASIDASRVVAA